MLFGRLGLDTARIPHADRHGLLWLARGRLNARDGTLSFEKKDGSSAQNDPLKPGRYSIPFQSISMILLGPGSTVSHDALRLLRAPRNGARRRRCRWRPHVHGAAADLRPIRFGPAAGKMLGGP